MITSIPKVRLRQFDIGQVVKLTGAYSKDERLLLVHFPMAITNSIGQWTR